MVELIDIILEDCSILEMELINYRAKYPNGTGKHGSPRLNYLKTALDTYHKIINKYNELHTNDCIVETIQYNNSYK